MKFRKRKERRWNSTRDAQIYCRRGSIQLWQFLLALLEDGLNGTIIVWTGKGLEFKLVEPEEVKKVISVEEQNQQISFFFHGKRSHVYGAFRKIVRQ